MKRFVAVMLLLGMVVPFWNTDRLRRHHNRDQHDHQHHDPAGGDAHDNPTACSCSASGRQRLAAPRLTLKKTCGGDIQQFCSDIQGRGKTIGCSTNHLSALSPDCHTLIGRLVIPAQDN